MNFDLTFALDALPTLLAAARFTLLAAAGGAVGAVTLGLCWEILRRSNPALRLVMQLLVDAIRSTPILVQLYLLYFVLPYYGLLLPPLVVGLIGLSLSYSGYLAEVFKAGLDAIPKGQMEAAAALGLTRAQTAFYILAPQMIRNVAPATCTYFVSILKATPYLAVIAVPEMLGAALDLASESFRYAEPVVVVGVLFLGLATLFSHVVGRLEARWAASTR